MCWGVGVGKVWKSVLGKVLGCRCWGVGGEGRGRGVGGGEDREMWGGVKKWRGVLGFPKPPHALTHISLYLPQTPNTLAHTPIPQSSLTFPTPSTLTSYTFPHLPHTSLLPHLPLLLPPHPNTLPYTYPTSPFIFSYTPTHFSTPLFTSPHSSSLPNTLSHFPHSSFKNRQLLS